MGGNFEFNNLPKYSKICLIATKQETNTPIISKIKLIVADRGSYFKHIICSPCGTTTPK